MVKQSVRALASVSKVKGLSPAAASSMERERERVREREREEKSKKIFIGPSHSGAMW